MSSTSDAEYDDFFFDEAGHATATGKFRLLDQNFHETLSSEGGHILLGISKERQEEYQRCYGFF